MANVGFSWKDILDPLGVRKLFTGKKKKIIKGFSGLSIQSADHAHRLIQSAGQGNAAAKGQLDMIKALAAEGDPTAIRLLACFGPIAKMVTRNLGLPSTLQARSGVRGTSSQGMAQRQQLQLKRQQEQLKAMRQAQIVRVQKGRLMAQAQQRLQQEQAKGMAQVQAIQAQWDAEAIALEDKLAAAEKQLERRDINDAMRQQLERQAAVYEAEIARIEAAQAAQPALAVAPIAVAQPVAAEEAPAGEPGDVEIEE
jgi:hypothetical protein